MKSVRGYGLIVENKDNDLREQIRTAEDFAHRLNHNRSYGGLVDMGVYVVMAKCTECSQDKLVCVFTNAEDAEDYIKTVRIATKVNKWMEQCGYYDLYYKPIEDTLVFTSLTGALIYDSIHHGPSCIHSPKQNIETNHTNSNQYIGKVAVALYKFVDCDEFGNNEYSFPTIIGIFDSFEDANEYLSKQGCKPWVAIPLIYDAKNERDIIRILPVGAEVSNNPYGFTWMKRRV